MSSPRNSGSAGRFGSDSDYGKRRKNFYASSTRRDFKSSASLLQGPAPAAGPSQSAPTRPSLRADTLQNSDYARSKYRDTGPPANSNSALSSRGSGYSKDSRYGSYGSKYAYSSNYYQDRSGGAYGSFSSAKRAENESFPAHPPSRDASSRDMVNTIANSNTTTARPDRQPFSRDTWRGAERPKPHAVIGTKSPVTSRFNPNNIPVNSRSGLNGLLSSVSNDYKKERQEPVDESSSSRWKSFSSPRPDRVLPSGPNSRFSTPKERIRSSGLTNSVGSSKRNDSYYPKPNRFGNRYNREGYDTGAPGPSRYGSGALNSREYHSKLVSPTSGSLYDTNASSESANVSNDPNVEYDEHHDREHEHDHDHSHHDGDEDEEEDEDEEDEDEEDEDDEEEGGEGDEEAEKEICDDKKPAVSASQPAESATSTTMKSEETDSHDVVDSHAVPLIADNSEKSSTLTDVPLSIESSLDITVEYPDGCLFPQTKLEAAYEKLKSGLAEDKTYTENSAPYVGLGTEFTLLPFFSYNLKRFAGLYEDQLRIVKNSNRALKKKKLGLIRDYRSMAKESEKRRGYMEEQLKVIHPADDDARKELDAIDIRAKAPEPEVEVPAIEIAPPAGRRGRRHGDSVTTEAEFEEILKSLKNELNEDPVARAQHVAATIPDLILDPIERRAFKFMDSNNFVQDRTKWEERLVTDFETNFTENEHDLFCDAFCRYPKRFGEISRYMGGLRTFNECVLHYYITKKAVNYKFLASQFKKKASKKSGMRKKKARAKMAAEAENAESTVSNGNDGENQPIMTVTTQAQAKPEEIVPPTVVNSKHAVSALEAEQPARKKPRTETVASVEIPASNTDIPIADENTEVPVKNEVIADTKIVEKKVILPEYPVAPPMDREAAGEHVTDEKKNAKHITSYWSITEVEEFPHLLSHYGSSWADIAEQLSAKSATMVRNYYQRNAQKFGWDALVANVDMRRGQFPPNAQPPVGIANGYNMESQNNLRMAPSGVHFGAGVTVGQSYGAQTNGVLAAAAPHSQPGFPPNQLPHTNAIESVKETHKSSIRNLLNNDASPQKPELSHPAIAPRRNNLSSLLNAPSSPVSDSAHAATPSNGTGSAKRANIESLLG